MIQTLLPVILFVAGLAITLLASVAVFLLQKMFEHEKRIQSVEQVQGNAISELKQEMSGMERKIDKLSEQLVVLSANIHKQKNEEAALTQTLGAVNKTMEKIFDKL